MSFAPQGLDGFSYWRRLLDYPLVAIGGLFLENAGEVIDRGADGIAVVRDINECANAELRTKEWVQLFENEIVNV